MIIDLQNIPMSRKDINKIKCNQRRLSFYFVFYLLGFSANASLLTYLCINEVMHQAQIWMYFSIITYISTLAFFYATVKTYLELRHHKIKFGQAICFISTAKEAQDIFDACLTHQRVEIYRRFVSIMGRGFLRIEYDAIMKYISDNPIKSTTNTSRKKSSRKRR